jgi:hypothetical protein
MYCMLNPWCMCVHPMLSNGPPPPSPHFSQDAEEELDEVTGMLDSIALVPGDDVRQSPFLDATSTLQSAPV